MPDNQEVALARLLRSYPQIKDEWALLERSKQYDERAVYTNATYLARHLVQSLGHAETAGFSELFSELDRIIKAGTPGVRNLMIVGLLEDIQNASIYASIPLQHWLAWLGPEAQVAWEMVTAMWASEISTTEFNHFVDGGEVSAT